MMFWCFNTVGHFHQINGSLNRFSLEIFADVGQGMLGMHKLCSCVRVHGFAPRSLLPLVYILQAV